MLQCVAVCCSVLQCVAVCPWRVRRRASRGQGAASQLISSQLVFAVIGMPPTITTATTLQYTQTGTGIRTTADQHRNRDQTDVMSVFQFVVVCGSMWRCVVVGYSILQCVAVRLRPQRTST